MSIIMANARASLADSPAPRDNGVAPEIQELLDHIAVELAEEYVRLTEAAAEAETEDP